jgi:hypothetical protein
MNQEGAMNAALQTLLAKQAITERLYTYCRSFDRMDHELALSVWHPGGTVQYGNQPVTAIEDYLGPSEQHRWSLNNCSHQITNILIEVKGARAVSEAYVTASLQEQPRDGAVVEHVFRGRYVDRWSRRGELWAIDHRLFVPDSYTRSDSPTFPAPDFLSLARRDRQDPSYLAWAELAAAP